MALTHRDETPGQVHYQDFRIWTIGVGDASVDVFTAIPEDVGAGQILLLLRDAVRVLSENKDSKKSVQKFKERVRDFKVR